MEIESIGTKDLIQLYRRSFGIDVRQNFWDVGELSLLCCEACDLQFFNPPVTGDQNFYERFQTFDWYYMDQKPEYEYACQYIDRSHEVLEVGCGKGAFGQRLAVRKYVGLEFSKAAAEKARRTNLTVKTESVQEHCKMHGMKYDVVCAFQVLEHVADVRSFIESCVACLKPGGTLIYSVPSADSFLRFANNTVLDMPPHHVSRWTDLALENVARNFPLEVVSIQHETLQPVHYDWYAAVTFRQYLNNLLGRKHKSIDRSLSGRALTRVGLWLGKPLVSRMVTRDPMPRGISVTCIYRRVTA